MSQPDLRAVLSQIHRLAGTQTPDEIPDRELLERFRGRRDEAAFAALVRRYGPMVWGVCRRVLGDRHDAEDAFQAAFLVLAGKAGSIRRAESLGAWLHRVARHLALRARGRRDRRQQVETARPANSSVTPSAGAEPSEELSLREALTILDEEVGRLPEKFRAPVVLCYLQGRTNEEAARELGYAAGTLKWRLRRARELLGERLSGRGVSLPAGAAAVLLAAGVSQAAVPASARAALAYSVHQTNGVSAGAARLAHELIRGMTMNRVKLWALGLLTLAVVGVGARVAVRQSGGGDHAAAATPTEENAPANLPAVKADLYGDPLPPGARVRLGTVRLRHEAFHFTYSPDGQLLASGGHDGLVRLWDAATGKEIAKLGGHRGFAYSVAFSPDSKLLATGDVYDIHLWDAATGKELRKMPGFDGGADFKKPGGFTAGIMALAFSPDGKLLAAGEGNVRISLWDVTSGRTVRRLEAREGSLQTILFLPGGEELLSATDTGVVRLWSTAGDRRQKLPLGPSHGRAAVAVAPDGKTIVTGGGRRVVRGMLETLGGVVSLWDAATAKELRREELPQVVSGVALSPDGKTFALAQNQRLSPFTENQAVQLWDAATWREVRRAEPFGGDVLQLAFSPDGKTLAGHNQTSIGLWEVATGRLVTSRPGHGTAVNAVAFSQNGREVVSISLAGDARRWDATTGRQIHTFQGDWENRFVVPSADGAMLLAWSGENRISLWDVAAGKRVQRRQVKKDSSNRSAPDGYSLSLPAPYIYQLALSADGRLLTSISNDDSSPVTVQRVDGGAEGPPPKPLKRQFGRLFCPSLSPDGRLMADIEGDKVHVRDTTSGALLRTLHTDSLQAGESLDRPLVFSADGRVVACASPRFVEPEPGHKVCRNKIRLWEVATGELLGVMPVPFVKVAAFSADGRTFAAGGGDYGSRGKGDTGSDIRVWDLATVTELTRFEGHGAYVSALAFSPNGQTLASGLVDSTVLLWDLAPALRLARRRPALRPEDFTVCWANLAGADACKAQASIWAFLDAPQQAVAFLQERLRPARAAEPGELRRLIAELDAEQFEVRQAAFRDLRKLDTVAESALREALKGRPSLEQRRRIEQLIAELQGPISTDELRQGVRAIAILEHIGGADARRLLEKLAAGPAEARLTREAAAALERLRRR